MWQGNSASQTPIHAALCGDGSAEGVRGAIGIFWVSVRLGYSVKPDRNIQNLCCAYEGLRKLRGDNYPYAGIYEAR